MKRLSDCPICTNHLLNERQDSERDVYFLECPVCGKYGATEEAVEVLSTEKKIRGRWHIIAGSIRAHSERNRIVQLRSDNILSLIETANPPDSPLTAVDMILEYLQSKTPFFGEFVELPSTDFSITFSKNIKEFENYLGLATKLDYVDNAQGTKQYSLTYKGWARLQEIKRTKAKTNQAFVAMWFSQEMRPFWENGFRPALQQSGFTPLRIDLLEHNRKIDDQIIAEIKRSSLMIADFTGNRGGVYFEAGFALGLGLPVIWTCRKDHIDDLHFDTRQYNHIIWQEAAELKDKLINRIEATILL